MTDQYRYAPYAGYGPDNTHVGRLLASHFVELVRALPGIQTICDLGCGTGYLAGQLIAQGRQVVGVDASESGIDLARRVHGAAAEFVCSPIDAALAGQLGKSRFDVVVSSDVIEHLYHPRHLVACAHEILKPGGYLVVGTPYHGYIKNLALSLLGRWDAHHEPNSNGGHIKFFSVTTLRWLLEQGGFHDLGFHFFGRAPFLWKHMICVASRNDRIRT